MSTFTVATRGLDGFIEAVESLPFAATTAAQLAINDTARWGRTRAAEAMLKQVAWPRQYLGNANNGKLRVSQYASTDNLQAVITGQFRPTSLARFVLNQQEMMRNKMRGPARVSVKPGRVETMDRAFLVRLRRGKVLDADNYNIGLAIRLRSGESFINKKEAVSLGRGVYLLYGPSVNQVFRSVSQDIAPAVSDRLASEFARQFKRLSNV